MSLGGTGGDDEESKVELKTSHKDRRSRTSFVTRIAPQELLEALVTSIENDIGAEVVPNEEKGAAYFSYTWVKPVAGQDEGDQADSQMPPPDDDLMALVSEVAPDSEGEEEDTEGRSVTVKVAIKRDDTDQSVFVVEYRRVQGDSLMFQEEFARAKASLLNM